MTLKVRADDVARDDDYIRSLHRARATLVDARAAVRAIRPARPSALGFPDRGGSNAAPRSADDDADERATDEVDNFANVRLLSRTAPP